MFYGREVILASQLQRREATRGALIAAARTCFVEQGFEATSTDAILVRAGVSKGALYHHFTDKADLLAAVFSAVSEELVTKAQTAASSARTPREGLRTSLKVWLRAALAPEPRRIILEIGPAVLGLTRARLIEDGVTLAALRRSVDRIVAHEHAQCPDVDLAARLLSALIAELALTALQRSLKEGQLTNMDVYVDVIVDVLIPAGDGSPGASS